MMKSLGVLSGIAAVIALIVMVSASVLPAGTEGKTPEEIVMKACSACHDTGKVCKNLGTKDKEAWLKAVNAMVKKGAAVDAPDIPVVAEYLTGLKADSKPVCK